MGPEKGRSMGIPAAEFVQRAWTQLATGSDHVVVGSVGPEKSFTEMVQRRREHFEGLSETLLAHFEL